MVGQAGGRIGDELRRCANASGIGAWGKVNILLPSYAVRTHKVQPLMVAAGTTQASTQAGMSVGSCALTATATAAMARKSLENIFSRIFFLWGRKEIEEISGGKAWFGRSTLECTFYTINDPTLSVGTNIGTTGPLPHPASSACPERRIFHFSIITCVSHPRRKGATPINP